MDLQCVLYACMCKVQAIYFRGGNGERTLESISFIGDSVRGSSEFSTYVIKQQYVALGKPQLKFRLTY